ncbi:MAG: sugar transferase [Spirochaetaceae bacterium]|nr:sugar transferase [Spirochaetaceae bacterium]
MIYRTFIKRLLDIGFSLIFILFTAPLFIFIAVLIKINSPDGQVFFKHKRIGKNGKLFNCYKFRTMVVNADSYLAQYLAANPERKAEYNEYFKLKNDPRIIKGIGHFLRNTSFDELPQFFNVLKGEMSVVGPRPIVEDEKFKYGEFYSKLISIKPGVTGLWQTSGRNDVSYARRVQLDMQYIDTINIALDFKIGFKTIKIILLRKGY